MSFFDRLREAIYKAPSGAQFRLQFDDVERAGAKKAAVHEFPQQDQADVQDLGNSAERFKLACYISGADYDQEADSFYNALRERGPGLLGHPRYGDIPVLALTWTQKERFVDGAGRADFEIEFIRAPKTAAYPITTENIEAAVEAQVEAAAELAAEVYESEFDPATAGELAASAQQALTTVNNIQQAFADIIASSEQLAAEFNAAVRDFETKIDQLMAAPAALSQALSRISRLPAQAAGSIAAKVTGYAGIIANSITSIPRAYSEIATFFMGLAALGMGASEASLTGTLRSREEAVFAADTLASALAGIEAGTQAAEQASSGSGIEVVGEAYTANADLLGALKASLTDASRALVSRSYDLRTEIKELLKTERCPLELVYSYYGSIEALDEFIESNGLQGDEIFIIPAGREVVHYG